MRWWPNRELSARERELWQREQELRSRERELRHGERELFARERDLSDDDIAEPRELLDSMLALSQTQILAQVTDEASIDSRTVGLLGFNGALLGGTLAAKSLLGHFWWTPLAAVACASGPCLWSVFKKTSAFGPGARRFYETFGAAGPLLARAQLLSDLDDTFVFNASRVRAKTLRLRVSLGLLVVGLATAGFLIAVVRPIH